MNAVIEKASLLHDFWRLTKPPEFARILSHYIKHKRSPEKLDCIFGGRRFIARRGDWPALREVFLEGEYDCLTKLFKTDDAPKIIDFGGHIGCFALRAFIHTPKAEIYSFEAAPDTADYLEQNQKLNPDVNWHVVRAALWSENKPIYLNRSPSSLGHRVGDSNTGEAVDALTPDSVLQKTGWEKIDLIKMDIEGAEEAVIPFADTLLSKTDSLLIEIHNDRIDGEAVFARLKEKFPHIYKLGGRWSSKPVLLFSRKPVASLQNWEKGSQD